MMIDALYTVLMTFLIAGTTIIIMGGIFCFIIMAIAVASNASIKDTSDYTPAGCRSFLSCDRFRKE